MAHDHDDPAPGERPPQAADDGAAGAPPSNTAPVTCNIVGPEGTVIVGAGIDSLYLSIPGQLKPGSQKLLDRLKEQAQSPDPELRALAQYPGHSWIFEVSDKGARMFSYVLTDSRYRIELARATAKQLPMAHVQISSAALAEYGVERCVADLMAVLQDLGEIGGEPIVSRVDMFVDATTTDDLDQIEDRQWVTRAHGLARYADLGRRTGYLIGQGGQFSLRLYAKTIEIQRSGKTHAERKWLANGWDGAATVWRTEGQFRRSALQDFGVRSVPGLLANLGNLWDYLTGKWCRLAIPNPDDMTNTRWLTHPFWAAISNPPDFRSAVPGGRKRLQRSRSPSDLAMSQAFISVLTSHMATYAIFDTGWALEELLQIVREQYGAQEQYTGLSLAREIARMVARKTRAFATGAGFRVPPEIPLRQLRDKPIQGRLDDDEDAPF